MKTEEVIRWMKLSEIFSTPKMQVKTARTVSKTSGTVQRARKDKVDEAHCTFKA